MKLSAATVFGALVLTGCPKSASSKAPRLLAAASAAEFADRMLTGTNDWTLSIGSSSVLARQIAAGAPADVFLCANRAWVDWLAERNLLSSEPVVLAWNHTVYASSSPEDPPADLAALAAELQPGDRIAIGDPGVPVGDLARSALKEAGLFTVFESHLVGFPDARAVLRAVSSGELRGGFPFASDVHGSRLTTSFDLDGETALFACGLSQDARATDLLESLSAQPTGALLRELGFSLVRARAAAPEASR